MNLTFDFGDEAPALPPAAARTKLDWNRARFAVPSIYHPSFAANLEAMLALSEADLFAGLVELRVKQAQEGRLKDQDHFRFMDLITEYRARRYARAARAVGSWSTREAPVVVVPPHRVEDGLWGGRKGDIASASSLQSLYADNKPGHVGTLSHVCRVEGRRYTELGNCSNGTNTHMLWEIVNALDYPYETWRYEEYHGGTVTTTIFSDDGAPPEHPFRWCSEGVRAFYLKRAVVLTRPIWVVPEDHPDDPALQALVQALTPYLKNSWSLEKLLEDRVFLREQPVRVVWWRPGGRLFVRLNCSLGAGETFPARAPEIVSLRDQLARLEKEKNDGPNDAVPELRDRATRK